MHAFIIEDDYLIAKDLQDMLDDLGFTKFSFARSEDAAILAANNQHFDLITADVRLLPGDGVNAVEAISTKRNVSHPVHHRISRGAGRTKAWRGRPAKAC